MPCSPEDDTKFNPKPEEVIGEIEAKGSLGIRNGCNHVFVNFSIYGSKVTHQGTAGFRLWFHLPGFPKWVPMFDPQPYFEHC